LKVEEFNQDFQDFSDNPYANESGGIFSYILSFKF